MSSLLVQSLCVCYADLAHVSVYINLPIGGVAFANIVFSFHTPKAAVPPPTPLREKILQMDLFGTFTITAATICYLLALQWGGTTKSWNDADVIGTLIAFGLLIVVAAAIEYFSGERALIVGRLLKDRSILVLNVFIFFAAGVLFIPLYYLPIYFQTTRGASAQQSGIDLVSLVLSAGLFSLIAGGIISATGLIIPILVIGSIMATVAAGLIYTLQLDSSSVKWIGYQILLGIGIGSVFQVPATVAQSIVEAGDIAPAFAMVLFFQCLGGAIWIGAAQSAFANRLVSSLLKKAPGVDPKVVLQTGATELRENFNLEQLEGIVKAFMDALRTPFAIAIACGGIICLLSVVRRWEKIKIKL